MGDINKVEITILKDATWSHEKESNPFFIRINELPQTNARNNNMVHWTAGRSKFGIYFNLPAKIDALIDCLVFNVK